MLDAALPLRASLASYCYGAPARPVSQVTPSRAEPMWKTRPIWPASAAQAADWPRLAEARGSLRHNLALKGASGEPAGRGLSPLAFHIGGHAVVHALRPARRGRLHTHHARLAALRLMEFSVSYSRSCHTPSLHYDSVRLTRLHRYCPLHLPPPANLLSRSEAGEATVASTRVHMPGRDQEATIESRMEGGERMRQYYLDHFQALIEAKPDTLEKKRGGDEEDKEIDK